MGLVRFNNKTIIVCIVVTCLWGFIIAQNKSQLQYDTIDVVNERVTVIFECETCEEKNKFSVSGPDSFTLKKVKFPLKKELKPGDYEMTYWQKRVQQIRLPFNIKPGVSNRIKVK